MKGEFYTPAYERKLDEQAELKARIDAIKRKTGQPDKPKGKRRVKKTGGGGSDPWGSGGGSGGTSSSSSDPWG